MNRTKKKKEEKRESLLIVEYELQQMWKKTIELKITIKME